MTQGSNKSLSRIAAGVLLPGLLTLTCPLVPSVNAQTGIVQRDDFKRPLKKCWETPKPETGARIVASDNELFFLSSPTTRSIQAIRVKGGQVEWTADFGGELLAMFQTQDGNPIYIANTGGTGAYVRILSRLTGVTLTQWELPSRLEKRLIHLARVETRRDDARYATASGDELLLGDTEGRIRSIDLSSGVLTVFGVHSVSADAATIVVGGGLLSTANNRWSFFRFDTDTPLSFGTGVGTVTSLLQVSSERFAFGDSKGRIGISRIGAKSPVWSIVTGGGISQISSLRSSLIVASRDNYLYSFDKAFGELNWKIRLPGRIRPISINESLGAVSAYDSNVIELVDLKTGRRVNRIELSTERDSIADFHLFGGRLAVDLGYSIAAYGATCGGDK